MIKKPHRHAELIKAYADGAQIQMRGNIPFQGAALYGQEWTDVEHPDWTAAEYRIAPEPEFPKSTLDYGDLCLIVNQAAKLPGNEGIQTKVARLAADYAIAVFIQSGEMRKYVEENP